MTRTCRVCGETDLPEAAFAPSRLKRGDLTCRLCAGDYRNTDNPGVSQQRLPDAIPLPTWKDVEGYLRRDEIRRRVWG